MSQDEEVLDQNENGEVTEEEVVDVQESESDGAKEITPEVKEPVQKQEKRPTWTMPVQKAQEEKRKAAEKAREEALAEKDAEIQRIKEMYEEKLRSNQSDPLDNELNEISQKHGIAPEVTKDLLNVFKKSIPKQDLSKYEEIIQEREMMAHKAAAERDFDERVLPLLKRDYPGVTPQHIADVREKVTNLAFSEGYNAYAIEDIYKVRKEDFEFKNGFSAEASGGHSSEVIDFSKVTDEEEIAMADNDPATYRKFLKWQESNTSRWS